VTKAKAAKGGKAATYTLAYADDDAVAKKVPSSIKGFGGSGTMKLLRLRMPDPFIAPMEKGSAVGKHLGAVSEQLAAGVRSYVERNPDGALRPAGEGESKEGDARLDGELFEQVRFFLLLSFLLLFVH
jgi:hypothetical protein